MTIVRVKASSPIDNVEFTVDENDICVPVGDMKLTDVFKRMKDMSQLAASFPGLRTMMKNNNLTSLEFETENN